MSHDYSSDLNYQYEPLGDGDTDLRLCQIVDQREENSSHPFKITIVPASLEQAPAYAVVSYRWGDPADTRRVPCGDGWLHVTELLYSCMSVIAQRGCGPVTKYDYWWIDQVCINQADDAEKSRQVKLMRKIFSCSSLTLVWLGSYEGWYDEKVKEFWDRIDALQEKRPKFELEDEPAGLASFGLPSLSDDSWLPLVSMLKEAWFERVWVIQEVVFSKNEIWFGYKGCFIPFQMMYWLYDCLTLNRRIEKDHRSAREFRFGSFATACMLRSKTFARILSNGRVLVPASDVSWQATAVLTITSNAKATDPRDRIYALYGFLQMGTSLLSHTSLDLLKPDYAKDMYALFKDVTRYCIEENEHLWPISYGGYFTDRDELCRSAHEQAPSWVFRLDLKESAGRHLSRDVIIGLPDDPADDFRVQRLWLEAFSACDHRKVKIDSHPDSNILALRGIHVEKIRACSQAFDGSAFYTDETDPIVELWRDFTGWLNFDPECTDEDEVHEFVTKVIHVIFPTALTDNSMLRKSELSRPNSRNGAEFWSVLAMSCRAQQSRWNISQKAIDLYEKRGTRAQTDEKRNGDWQNNCKYFVTESGRLGFGPVHMLPGDDLFVLYGGFFLHVLRRCGEEYHHLGEAFVREYADGAVVRELETGIREEQWVHVR